MDEAALFEKLLNGGAIVLLVGTIAWLAWRYAPKIVEGHLDFLKTTSETQKSIATSQDRQTEYLSKMDERISQEFNRHHIAITHTINGVDYFADGETDKAKESVQKARDGLAFGFILPRKPADGGS